MSNVEAPAGMERSGGQSGYIKGYKDVPSLDQIREHVHKAPEPIEAGGRENHALPPKPSASASTSKHGLGVSGVRFADHAVPQELPLENKW